MKGHTLKIQNYESYKLSEIGTIPMMVILGIGTISRESTCLAERDKTFN